MTQGAQGVHAVVHDLLRDRDRRAGIGDGKCQLGQTAGQHLHEPAALTLPPDSDPLRVDTSLASECFESAQRLVCPRLQAVITPIPRRFAASRLVEGEGSDPPLQECFLNRREVAVGIAVRRARALHHQHRRTPLVRRGEMQRARQPHAPPFEQDRPYRPVTHRERLPSRHPSSPRARPPGC